MISGPDAGRRLHWCLGMYASGSTWAFNVARAIVGPALTRFVSVAGDLRAEPALADAEHALVKSHETDGEAQDWLAEHATSLVISVRDPRDAVASVMRHQRLDFAQALGLVAASAQTCLARADDPHALVLRYEDGFTADPATPARIARAMGFELDPARSADIARAHNREAVRASVEEAFRARRVYATADKSDFLDPVTHWHLHHVGRDGRSGVWADWLSREQVETVEAATADAMRRWDYSPHFGVASRAKRLDKIHVINLDRAPDRLACFGERHPDLVVERFSAVDGAAVSRADGVSAGSIAPDNAYSPGALGCALSHIALWRRCAAGAEIFHVAEDDAVLRRDFATEAMAVLDTLADWDVVVWANKLDWPAQVAAAPGFGVTVLQYDPEAFDEGLFRAAVTPVKALRLVSCTGTLCYSVSPKGAARMLADCLPIGAAPAPYLAKLNISLANSGLDVEMSRHYVRWRAYLAAPPLAASLNNRNGSSVRDHLAAIHDIRKVN